MPDFEQASWFRFDVGLRHLRTFVQHEGHAKVLEGHIDEDGYRLGNFVSTRRKSYRSGKLSEARIAALESFPGWTWDPLADIFETRLRHLRAFVQREGHAKVPGKHIEEDGYPLGRFVNTQRTNYRVGKLPQDRIAALESVTGWAWGAR